MRREYALTFLAEFTILGTGLLVFWMAARYWSPVPFGEYVLARRTLSLIYLPCILGLGVSLTRYIAAARARGASSAAAAIYFPTSVVLAGVPFLGLGGAFLIAPSTIASLLFGKADYVTLLPALYLATLGLILHSLTYGYFRGHLRMVAANLLQVINQGLIPLAAFFVPHLSVTGVLTVVGLCWVGISGSVALRIVVQEVGIEGLRRDVVYRAGGELVRYGLPRLPGEIALTALLTLPGTLTAHLSGMEQAGYVAFSVSALSMIGSAFAPIGLVLLPTATAMVARGEGMRLRRPLLRLIGVGSGLVVLGLAVLEVAAPWLVTWYLGPDFRAAATVLRVVAIGALPYVVYILLRSPIDALSVEAHNARNLVVGLGAFCGMAAIWPSTLGVSAALTVGLGVAGTLSLRDARSLLRRQLTPAVT